MNKRVFYALGVLLVALGLIVFGLSLYSPSTVAQQKEEVSKIEAEIQKPQESPKSFPSTPVKRSASAVVTIPALGKDWKMPVKEGVDEATLATAIGHYPNTPLAGEAGNAGYAGHRSGYGNPLLDIEDVKVGDSITVRSNTGTWTYRVMSHKIVDPQDVSVLSPRSGKWLTLTTCWPKWGNSQRYVLFARLA